MVLPVASGTPYEGMLGWTLIILQLISILNQIWYNMKPLILGVAGYVASKVCGTYEKEAEEDDLGEEDLEDEDEKGCRSDEDCLVEDFDEEEKREKKEKDYVEDVEDGVGEECTLPLGPPTDCPRNQIYPLYPELAGKVSSSPKWRSEEFV